MPEQPVAQGDGMGELVVGDFVAFRHLRLDLALGVNREQRVVNHVAVVAGDVGRAPDRIDRLEVGVHDRAHDFLGLCCGAGSCQHQYGAGG